MATLKTPEAIFEKAAISLRDGLNDEDKRLIENWNLKDHGAMIASARKACRTYVENSGVMLRCSTRIAAFAESFAPFFDVMAVFVQVKAEWIAIFWGTILLVFKLGSSLVSFLDRVTFMFEELSVQLPQYRDWYKACRLNPYSRSDNDRLGSSLAQIYGDCVEFTLHIYFMFTRKSKGRFKRARLAGELMLRPFEYRFSQLKERISRHCEWFETEAAIHQHEMISRTYTDFRQFLADWEKGDRKEVQAAVNARDARRRELLLWVNSPDYHSLHDHINSKIQPGSGEPLLKLSQYVALKNSDGRETPANESPSILGQWLNRILFFSAKPGFGKTYLSVQVINDLLAHPPSHPPDEDPPAVCFFHFTEVDRHSPRVPDAALRAIVAQMIHSHRRDPLTLDALAMVERETGSGQSTASSRDVRALMDILLRRHSAFFVIDGIDECSDPTLFLEEVRRLCLTHPNCRVLLLGRPNTPIPDRWQYYESETEWRVDLDPSMIREDIQRFLEASFHPLCARGLFGGDIRRIPDLVVATSDDLFAKLSDAAEGIFLWARTLVILLGSPALTPGARLRILRDPTLVSLESLYDRILCALVRSGPAERRVARAVFQWLAFSAIPLSMDELHTAISIVPGSRTGELDYLAEYPACIPRITGSLVEISAGRKALVFIHATFKDHLVSGALSTNITAPQPRPFMRDLLSSTFKSHLDDAQHDHYDAHDTKIEARRTFGFTNRAKVQSSLASTCISYLTFDVAARPLSGIERDAPFCRYRLEAASNTLEATAEDLEHHGLPERCRRDSIRDKYPFLCYSTLFWYYHLEAAHDVKFTDPPAQIGGREPEEQWIPILSHLLSNRRTVTMWVEASYTFMYTPGLDSLLRHLIYLKGPDTQIPLTVDERERRWVYLGLHQLSEALQDLSSRKRSSLLSNPSLIWQEDIKATSDRSFWPVWEETSDLTLVDPSGRSQTDGASRRLHYRPLGSGTEPGMVFPA